MNKIISKMFRIISSFLSVEERWDGYHTIQGKTELSIHVVKMMKDFHNWVEYNYIKLDTFSANGIYAPKLGEFKHYTIDDLVDKFSDEYSQTK